MAGMRTVSPLPTMAVQEASQVAEARSNHDDSALPRPPKLMKMEMVEGSPAMQNLLQQQGGFLNRPNISSDNETPDAANMIENEMGSNGYLHFSICYFSCLTPVLLTQPLGQTNSAYPTRQNSTTHLFLNK